MTINLKQHKADLLFLPLGGTEQIGINLYLYHYNGKWLIVDMGLGFADDYFPGVDILVPDISFITKNRQDFVGLVLTHAHEDHIGAIQYLWNEFKLPIYCTKFTSCVLKNKLAQMGIANQVKIHEVAINSKFKVGEFDLEMIGLTHSIPEMNGLVLRTEHGTIFHTGDWKFDEDPVVGATSNMKALEDLGKENILAMVCDSTNIFNEGFSGSEGSLVKSMTDLIGSYKQNLVVVSSFASNVARLHTIAKAAEACGRKVALAGTSLWKMYDAALECGYLHDLAPFMRTKEIERYHRHEVLVIATGCQGEPRATTSKLARAEHPDFKVRRGDVMIFSSKIIPGNEDAIFGLFNKFCKMGVEVMTEKDHFVHVSGHPARAEIAKMYDIIKPKVAIPMHGEPMHLHEHAKFARKHGAKFSVQVNNGAIVKVNGDKPEIIAQVPTAVMAIDGNFIIPSNSEVLSMRRRMRDQGLVVATIIINRKNKLLKDPIILAPGVLDSKEDREYFAMLEESIIEYMDSHPRATNDEVENKVRSIIKRILQNETAKEPKILVTVTRLEI
jgi:ribonuclease J